jgi:hypothetical protein
MATEQLFLQLREGMQVVSADGKKLGKIIGLHVRDTEAYLEVMSEADWWKFWLDDGLFLPAHLVTTVERKQVRISMDAKTAKGCRSRPIWIPREIRDPNMFAGGGGGGM